MSLTSSLDAADVPAERTADRAGEPVSGKGTVEYLLRRIRNKGDFPALSATINIVNRAASSDSEPLVVLCNSILKDFSLTSRLLKIANASNLNHFGGAIGTVSRAISILGYDAVRNISMSLVLFEHMHDRSNAVALKDEVVAAYFSGLLAREIYPWPDRREAEQAFICAMFRRLGRLLATFYLYEEAQLIERHVRDDGWDEARAAREVLGATYEELGIGIGRAWNLPEDILECMRDPGELARALPSRPGAVLHVIAGLANELADIVMRADASTREARLAALVARYGAVAGRSKSELSAAVQACTTELLRDADALGGGVALGGFVRKARAWREAPAASSAASVEETQRLVADSSLADAAAAGAIAGPAEPGRRQAALAAGVQDITNTLVGDHSTNDVLRIILETMYRSIGFDRALLFTPDAGQRSLRCRFGFGADAETIVDRRVCIPLDGARDIFYAAAVLGADLCIQDIESDKVRPHVPAWYRKGIGARGMVLLPIVDRKKTVALIYADSSNPATLHFSAEELGLLKTLRNQALLAMRQAS
jgi:HD-like signal output (HDOD) protein/GAF domain-containing protein